VTGGTRETLLTFIVHFLVSMVCVPSLIDAVQRGLDAGGRL
jgi:hypothetical protein